ncbi:hypothetical protein ACIQM3_17840 [Streptomyces sp. NPDC091271]|uniref:hypothetical protein n=1 Tax=Streptomyces sp. NPDC091271 TaxID=3365980 RepID=UPI003802A0B2
MLTRAEPDFLPHSAEVPAGLPGPGACEPFNYGLMPWETKVAGGDAAWSGAAGRPAAVDVWARCKDAAGDPALSRALLAFALEGLIVPVGTRPYPAVEPERRGGAGQAVVLSQTITFHEPFVMNSSSRAVFDVYVVEVASAGCPSRTPGPVVSSTQGGELCECSG